MSHYLASEKISKRQRSFITLTFRYEGSICQACELLASPELGFDLLVTLILSIIRL